ncbi:TatD family deoxyribonuclease [Corallococcus sp. H22C18031201]|nr:TatD family deoxyribonuclease [Corallococcus sp. H22C18031201]
MKLVDAHCHLEPKDFAEVGPVLERARAAGLVHAVLVGQFHGPGNWGNALELAAAHPEFLSPTLGIHPHEAARVTEEDFAVLERTCARPEVRAVGEAGLDYYYDNSPREVQATVFRRQCALARALGKPLVVHVRDAHEDCDRVLADERVTHGVIHCFTGDTDAARRYLDRGFFLSLSGVVTYKKTEALQDAVRFAPLERLLVETDSPYLAPVPHRGRKNEPAHVVETARKVAELKGVSVEEVAAATTANAARLFSLPLR